VYGYDRIVAKRGHIEQGTCSPGDSVVACDIFLAYEEGHEALRPRSSHRRNGDFSMTCRQMPRAYAFSPPESSSTSLAAAVLNLEINWYRALRRAVAEAGESFLLHIEQEKYRETRIWIGPVWGSHWRGVRGLSWALCVGSTMVIIIKQNNWRQSRGSWGTILCLASSCPDAQAGVDLPSVPALTRAWRQRGVWASAGCACARR